MNVKVQGYRKGLERDGQVVLGEHWDTRERFKNA